MSGVSFADVMAAKSSGRIEDVVTVWFDANLHNQWQAKARKLEDLDTERTEAEARADRERAGDKSTGRRMNAKRRTVKVIDAEMQSLADEMQSLIDDNPTATYDVRVRAATRADWNELKAEHPAKSGVTDDDKTGVHWADFCRPSVVLCLVDPEPTAEVGAFLDESLSSGEWDRLGSVVMALNEWSRQAPFSPLAASLTRGRSDA